ncbi:ATP-dependent DNA helicase [Frankliniella fusca]|uniref:ATP-dependent DNA helicase n=1 Tax=Frankliniella fusca TaxID=407009 RepID=A0AAE1LMX5_9NEOP|nr:ATP-dependent DNA helicase [Frankliniella fusca]
MAEGDSFQTTASTILITPKSFTKCPIKQSQLIFRIQICEGFAGSGKSVLLRTMVELVEKELGEGSSWVLAPTGSSAMNVNGQTIHSAVRLNWQDLSNMPELKGETLFRWRERYEKVKFVFVEEYSMVGCKLMYVFHKRLCQLTDSSMSFGNLTVWFIGNIRQLPPVADTAWYKEDISDASAIVVSGKISENDKVILKSRFRTVQEIELMPDFENAVHIFSKNKDVEIFNLVKLEQQQKPVLFIDSENGSRHAKACSSDQDMGLPRSLYLSIGCRVMLKRNLWVEGGLVNGSLGTVIDIVYKSSADKYPLAVIVKFDCYHGPVLANGGVPILRYSTRVMFPLVLAYSVTIYKSQGLTLPKVVLHLISKEMAAGEFYVALSRVRTPSGICIVYDGENIADCPLFCINGSIYKERIKAEQKLMLKASRAV